MSKIYERKGLAATVMAATFGVALAGSAAWAQDENGGNEQIEVSAPRHHHVQSTDIPGAEIRNVAISREVRFDDLDLRTAHGARLLRERIRSTALILCRQADVMYPVKTDDSPPCYRTAVDGGMIDANRAIMHARGYAANE